MTVEIRRLTDADIPAALVLSTAAGWNQLAVDWERLLALAPAGCHGGWVGETLVATTTVIAFDDVGWVGMVLVDEDHRQQGYGSEIVQHAVDAARERGLRTLGLDATALGRSLYKREGFEVVGSIERLGGCLTTPPDVEAAEAVSSFGPAVRSFDRTACGVSRGALLDRLLDEAGTHGFVCRVDGRITGHAVLRPGRERWHLGPVVTDGPDALRSVLAATADRLGDDPVFVDALGEGDERTALSAAGLTVRRELDRMTMPPTTGTLAGDTVVAAAGFELG